MVEEEFFDLSHAGTNDFHALISDLILAQDKGLDIGKGANGIDVNVSDVGFGKVNLLSLRCDKSVLDDDLLGNVVGIVLGEFVLELLELFLSNGKGTLRFLFCYLKRMFCYLIYWEFCKVEIFFCFSYSFYFFKYFSLF
jgi:hypothetical protein